MRDIRSFVLREGRLTPGQERALAEHWPAFGIDDNDADPASRFPVQQPLVVEIGFGMGDSLLASAKAEPGKNFIGVEVHRPGVGHLLVIAAEAGVSNLRVYRGDAVPFLRDRLGAGSCVRIQVFFPDPWPKSRHHKRRIVNPPFVELALSVLAPGGILQVATDWVPYAEHMAEVLADYPMLAPVNPPPRPGTKYERRGLGLGHEVRDLAWQFTPAYGSPL